MPTCQNTHPFLRIRCSAAAGHEGICHFFPAMNMDQLEQCAKAGYASMEDSMNANMREALGRELDADADADAKVPVWEEQEEEVRADWRKAAEAIVAKWREIT